MKLKDIQRLEQDGFISPELAQQIAAHYASATGNGVWLRRLLMLIAGCMVLGGIISLIAANWEEIPPLLKMLAGIALLIGFWVGFFRLRQAVIAVFRLIEKGFSLLFGHGVSSFVMSFRRRRDASRNASRDVSFVRIA